MNPTKALPSVFDVNSLQSLKAQVKSEDPEAIRTAARQFEALFLQMVLKSMRDAVPREDGLFDNEQSRMYESLLDQQLAQVMTSKGKGLGLAAVIERQLTRQPDVSDFPGGLPVMPPAPSYPVNPPSPSLRSPVPAPAAPMPLTPGAAVTPSERSSDFVNRMAPHAQAAERRSGIPAQFMLAQAALETGWGRAEPRLADGRTSFNVFGIKADSSWQGARVTVETTEYVNGKAERQREQFRAYNSYADAFSDYARLLTTSPRYANAVGRRDPAGFAQALQQAGYATDPQYAAKLEQVMASPALAALSSSSSSRRG